MNIDLRLSSYESLVDNQLFHAISKICEILIKNGACPYFIGGCVRDALLNVFVSDFDVEVFGLNLEKISQLLEFDFHTIPQKCYLRGGISFEVLKIKGYNIDISVPRDEVKIGNKHSDFEINYLPNCTIEQAASRRDFTINAIYFDVKNDKLHDPYDGVNDLRNKILRNVSERFCEDSLRVLRGMQFAGRFELTSTPELIDIASSLTPLEISPERIFSEWRKFILLSRKPSYGLKFLKECGWIKFFPEIDALIPCMQDEYKHPEGSVFRHTCLTLDLFAQDKTGINEDDLIVGFAMLCHDFGKPYTTTIDDKGIHHYEHDIVGVPLVRSFLERMRAPKQVVADVELLVLHHMSIRDIFKLPDGHEIALMKLANKIGRLDRLLRVCKYDSRGRGGVWGDPNSPEYQIPSIKLAQSIVEKLGILKNGPTPIIQGRDLINLGLQPSMQFKEILEKCFDAQLNLVFKDYNGGLKFLYSLLNRS